MTAPSRLHRPYFRNGPDHRSGADVSFQDIVTYFGFRTVTIGKWVSKDEQQLAANLMFDALCDLMDMLNIPQQVISLNGTLSIAFGSGGQKHSSAHYAPHTRQLALAKNAGGGALAHEWFHAFDHYICEHMFERAKPMGFASQYWLDDMPVIEHRLNALLSDCFAAIFLTDDGQSPHPFVMRSTDADRALNMFYFAQPQELAARAFEAVIQSQPIKNAFLVQGTKQSQEAKLGLYPDDQQRREISARFVDYFSLLSRALNRT